MTGITRPFGAKREAMHRSARRLADQPVRARCHIKAGQSSLGVWVWPLHSIDLRRLFCEGGLVAASGGLLFVGGSFVILIGINIFEQASGRLLCKPLSMVKLAEPDLPHVLVQIPVFNEPDMV